MNREEIAKELYCDYVYKEGPLLWQTSWILESESVKNKCYKTADWHISEVALAERKARVEVVNSIKLLATTAGLGAMNRYMEETITANSEPVREGV